MSSPRYLALTNIRRRSQSLPAATEDKHRPPSTPNRARTIALPCPYRPFRCCIVIPSVDLGLVTGDMALADACDWSCSWGGVFVAVMGVGVRLVVVLVTLGLAHDLVGWRPLPAGMSHRQERDD